MEKTKAFFKMLLLIATIIAWATVAVTQGMIKIDNVFAVILAWVGTITIGVGIGMFVIWLLFDGLDGLGDLFCKSSS